MLDAWPANQSQKYTSNLPFSYLKNGTTSVNPKPGLLGDNT